MNEEDAYVMGSISNNGWDWQRDDTTMLVTYADGITRPYTAEEIVARDIRISKIATDEAKVGFGTAYVALIADINASLDLVQTVIDATSATINAAPAASIKTLARGTKRTLQTCKDLARLMR